MAGIEGFVVCPDCMEEMIAIIEVKASDIIESIVALPNEIKKIHNLGNYEFYKLLERRRNSLDALLSKMRTDGLAG
jgi:hypothetical protein